MAWAVSVDEDKCTGEVGCADLCPLEVFALQNAKAVPVSMDEGLGCTCVKVCEHDAICLEAQ